MLVALLGCIQLYLICYINLIFIFGKSYYSELILLCEQLNCDNNMNA